MKAPKRLKCPRCGASFESPSPDVLETLFVRHACRGQMPVDLALRVMSHELTEPQAWRLTVKVQ